MHIWYLKIYTLKLFKSEGEDSLGWYFNKQATLQQNKPTGHSCCTSSPGQSLCPLFCLALQGKPKRTARGRRTWNDVPQITRVMMLTPPGFDRHKLSSDTTQIPREPRPQPANNYREAMLIRFVHDSMSSKICLHLGMQKETLNLKQN